MVDKLLKLNSQGLIEETDISTTAPIVDFEDFSTTSSVLFNTKTYIKAYNFLTSFKQVGRYRVSADIRLQPGDTKKYDAFELRVDGTTISQEVIEYKHKKDSVSRYQITLLGYYDLTSSGTFNIEVWARQQDAKNSYLRGAIAEVWRVS